MQLRIGRLLWRLLRASAYSAAGALVVLVVVFIAYMERRPDLSVWHLAQLDEEFTAASGVATFADYLALEQRLFAQLDAQVYAKIPDDERRLINRYNRDSLSDPARWSPNWNRSFELPAETPKAGVLLLHGMSDSPLQPAQPRPAPQCRRRLGAGASSPRARDGAIGARGGHLAGHGSRRAVGHATTSPNSRRRAPLHRRLLQRGRTGRALRARCTRGRGIGEGRATGAAFARDRCDAGGGACRLAGAHRSPAGARKARLERHPARVRPLQVRLFRGQRGRCGLPPDQPDPETAR